MIVGVEEIIEEEEIPTIEEVIKPGEKQADEVKGIIDAEKQKKIKNSHSSWKRTILSAPMTPPQTTQSSTSTC